MISVGISLIITKSADNFNDYVVQTTGYSWALLISIITVMGILIIGYFLNEKLVNKLPSLVEKSNSKSDFSKFSSYVLFAIMSIVIVLAMSSTIY